MGLFGLRATLDGLTEKTALHLFFFMFFFSLFFLRLPASEMPLLWSLFISISVAWWLGWDLCRGQQLVVHPSTVDAGCLYLGDSVRASGDATFRNKSTHTDYFLLNDTFIHISCFVFVLVFALSPSTVLYCGDIVAFNLQIALKRALHPMWKECIGCSDQGWTIFFKLRKMLIIK